MNGVQTNTMTLTKEQQIAKRRARVAQMYAEGAVMTDSLRKKIRDEAKRRQQLEDAAMLILAGSNRKSSVPMGTVPVEDKSPAPEANVKLSARTKVDKLAAAADAILRELQG
jgi:hypothetical protein